MLTAFTVRNFKSVAEAKLELTTINVLIGENGAGKSSLVQALALMKQSRGNNGLLLSGPLLDLGSFRDVLHWDATPPEIEFELEGSAAVTDAALIGYRAKTVRIHNFYSVHEQQGLQRLTAKYDLGKQQAIHAEWTPVGGGHVTPNQLSAGPMGFTLAPQPVIGGGAQVNGTSSSGPVEQRVANQATRAVNSLLHVAMGILTRSFLVPAIRGIERQSYDLGDAPSTEFNSPSGSLVVGQALATTISYRRELEKRISQWLDRITGRSIEGRSVPARRVSLNAIARGHIVNLANEGFGSNQLTYVLTQLALLEDDSLLAIEEPEIHLHPAAQIRLINVLVESTREAKSQLLLTTHSEHVLYALMALVAEGKLPREAVSIQHVSNESGSTVLRPLKMDESGRIFGGIPGFFDVQVQEFRRYLDAAEKQQ